jgi:DNA-binding LytR/AlgR family response regulator
MRRSSIFPWRLILSDLRVLLCDDEPLAVERLASMLRRIAFVEIVAATTDAEEALALIARERPDLAFLDVEMPGLDGFDLVEAICRLRLDPSPPLIAFVTAHRQFAFDAFDVGAVDFLSKPVRMARLEQTLQRARAALDARDAARRLDDMQQAIESIRQEKADRDDNAHVWVQRRGENVRIALEQLDRVEAEGAYVRLHTGALSYLHRAPITEIEARLHPERFVRVHRSHIVRSDYVASVRRTVHGGSELILRGGERIPIGRKYAGKAKASLMGRSRPS